MEYGRCHILNDWPDWDYEIHAQKEQIARQGRAMNYPFSFEIDKKNKTARFSSTSELPYYETSLTSCNCGDFEQRGLPCKHIYRLAVELGIIEIIKRKPTKTSNSDVLAEIYASDDIDNHPEQLKRIKSAQSAKTTPSSIDKENKTGIFPGSGKKPYETTLHSCTCRDFFIRRLPCKHMYRLKMELGLMQETAQTGVNKNMEFSLEEAIAELEKLTEKSQKIIKNFLAASISRKETNFTIIINNETADLQTCPLLNTKISDKPDTDLHFFKRNEIIKMLDDHNVSGFKRNISIDKLIQWCCENIPNIWNVFPKVTVCCFSENFQKVQRKTYKYLLRKYDWSSYYTEKDNIDHMIEVRYPYGAIPEDLTFNISLNGNTTKYGNPNIYHFPDDEITNLLTFYGHNRCLNGFDTTLKESELTSD